VAEDAGVRTEMYSNSTDQERSPIAEGVHAGREDESVDIASHHSDMLSGLRERAERLERARQLLDGGTKGESGKESESRVEEG
jgi:hypothetical protein